MRFRKSGESRPRRHERVHGGRRDACGARKLGGRKNFRENSLRHESGEPKGKTLASNPSADSGAIWRAGRQLWRKRDDRRVLHPGHPFMPSLNR